VFPTIEEAIDGLYPNATKQKRSRLRNLAFLVHETDGILTDPETLSERQLLRLHAAWTKGFGDLVTTALSETCRRAAADQWDILGPILAEAEAPEPVYASHERREGRPRRVSRPRAGMTLRREMREDGWTIHLTGPEARGVLVDHIFEEIERLIGRR
jgi:ParB family chromosome partitioning protein